MPPQPLSEKVQLATSTTFQIYHEAFEKTPQLYCYVHHARRLAGIKIDCSLLTSMALKTIRGLRRHPDPWPVVVPRILDDLSHLKAIWMVLVRADTTGVLIEPMLQLFEAQEVKNDRIFMALAIQNDSSCTAHLGRELWHDSEFVLQIVQSEPKRLTLLPGEVFEDRPEWLQQALVLLFQHPSFSVNDASDFFIHVRAYVPLREFIVKEWIPSGGPLSRQILSDDFPDLKVPKHVLESFVHHCTRQDYLVESFRDIFARM